jgi:signal transduction histidine kinase
MARGDYSRSSLWGRVQFDDSFAIALNDEPTCRPANSVNGGLYETGARMAISAPFQAPVNTNDELLACREQMAALQQQLARAQRLAALGELLSTTTHEFNNVLMGILNYAQMAQRHKDPATRDKYIDKILAAAKRASKITSSILAAARNRSGGLEPTNLKKIVEDTLVLLERDLSKYRIALETNLADGLPDTMAMGNQIQQVLLNLLINARQAMPNGGRLILRLEHDAAAGTVDLVVRDTGTGIPAEKLPRIFEPYFTTKNGPDETGMGGTGLGLSSCRQIIEAHHGRIRVDSTVGVGTQFTIKLPVAKKPVAATSAA